MKNGTRLFYRSWIPKTKDVSKTVLCIHGFGCHSNVFARLGNFLAAKGIATYGLDLRGFGNSVEEGNERGDVEDANVHLEDIDEMVSFIRDKHQNKPVFMLGHSQGGSYSLWYASSRLQPLSGIILVATGIRSYVKPPLRLILAVLFYALFAPRKMIDPSFLADEWREISEDELSTTKFSVRYLMWVRKVSEKKLMSYASMIHVPTLILIGEADNIVDPKGTKEGYDKLAATDKEIKSFPGADHWLYHAFFYPTGSTKYSDSDRRKVFDAVVQWLERH